MIYLGSLALCLFLTVTYDILGYIKNKWHWYYLLLFWFIIVSGFQYMVGTDIPVYMDEYNKYYNSLRFDVGAIEGKRQPGWVLLCYGCRQITHDFTLLKLIQSFFVNIAIFSFFKRESKYVFCCITLYALSSFLLINFNILRQGIALGFILYFISSYKRKKYILSVLFLFMAYMFHNSALLALIIPIFGLIKYNKKLLIGVAGFFVIIIIILLKTDLESLMYSFIEGDYMGEGMSEMSEIYLKSNRLGVQEAKMGVGKFFRVSVLFGVSIYYIQKYRELYIGGLGLVYIVFLVFSFVLPIMFRFGAYFELPFYLVLSSVIIEYPHGRLIRIRYVFYFLAFAIYSFFPYKQYTSRYIGSSYRYIDQYYPYHSIFEFDVENEIDRKKMMFFKFNI